MTEWVTVSDPTEDAPETKIVMDTIGDEFIGKFLGFRTVPSQNGSYTQARFENNGTIYFINANHSLRTGLEGVRKGTLTKFEYAADLDTGQESPMKVFKVATAKVTSTVASKAK